MFYSSVELLKETVPKYRGSLYTLKKSIKMSFPWAFMVIFAATNQNKLALPPFGYEFNLETFLSQNLLQSSPF
jgi:hypothetical protein